MAAVPDAAVRGFLLHNFRAGEGWRIGLTQIAASLRRVETWDPVAARYPGPVLFVTGGASDYVLPAYHDTIRALFPTARFVAIAGAGHWLHAEQPAAFNAAGRRLRRPGSGLDHDECVSLRCPVVSAS